MTVHVETHDPSYRTEPRGISTEYISLFSQVTRKFLPKRIPSQLDDNAV